jgi:hypothetical protein
VRAKHSKHERGHYITLHDIYRLRKTIERENATGSISSDQPNKGRSDECLGEAETQVEVEIKVEEDLATHNVDEAECQEDSADADEDATSADGQPEGCAVPNLEVPPSSVAIAQAYTPAANTPTCVGPTAPWPRPMAPYAVPCPPSHHGPMSPSVPPPIAAYLPFPPYHVMLYPVHPAYSPSPP